jgi:integrase
MELLQAPWSEFDLDNARWVITPERMKMDKPHIVPLPRQTKLRSLECTSALFCVQSQQV